MTDRKPTIGRIVTYRTDGRNGLSYDLPAIITCTVETHPGNYPSGLHNPCPIPSSPDHVHLTVFTPGGMGTQIVKVPSEGAVDPRGDGDFIGATSMIPGSGTYVELDVPHCSNWEDSLANAARTWRWPTLS